MPEKPTLKNRIGEWFARVFTPTKKRATVGTIHGEQNQASRVTADGLHGILGEAEGGNTHRLFALYRDIIVSDSHIWSCLSTRKLAVLNKQYAIIPVDEKNADDVAAADACRAMVDDFTGWHGFLRALLDSALWPVVLIEKSFCLSSKPGRRYDLADLRRIDPQQLDYTTGEMRLALVNEDTKMLTGSYEVVNAKDFITHRAHLMTTPDEWGGPMRTLVFWWLFSTQDRDWWIRFLDRFGSPFLVGRYPAGNDDDKFTLLAAFDVATKVFGIAVSDETRVEVHETASSSHGDAFEKFIQVANREKSKVILGQTLSSDAQPTGIGTGATSLQSEVRKDIEDYDGVALGETIRHQLFAQYLAINGLPGRPPRFVFPPDTSTEAASLAKLLSDLSTAQLEPTDDSLEDIGRRLGFGLQRKAAPATPGGAVKAFLAPTQADIDAGDAIIGGSVAGLAQEFRGSLAPLRLIIASSSSPEDAIARATRFYRDWRPGQVARLVEEVLASQAANGAS